jgi:hypothetical protein
VAALFRHKIRVKTGNLQFKARNFHQKQRKSYPKGTNSYLKARKSHQKGEKSYPKARNSHLKGTKSYPKARKSYLKGGNSYSKARNSYLKRRKFRKLMIWFMDCLPVLFYIFIAEIL